MRYIELIASYLPSVVVEDLVRGGGGDDSALVVPRRSTFDGACLFADVSGFTRLSERLTALYGQHAGAEQLAKQLNSYFSQLVKTINSEGGDVFKFAGDAMIVLWPWSDDEDLAEITRRAAQCAARIQGLGNEIRFDDDDELTLRIKIGVGAGALAILNVGGVKRRTEYVAVGEPMQQAFAAEALAAAGDVVLSPSAWKHVAKQFTAHKVSASKKHALGAFYRLDLAAHTSTGRARNRRMLNLLDGYSAHTEKLILQMLPSAATQFIDPGHPEFETLASELRRVTVVFLGLGLPEATVQAAATSDAAMDVLHRALELVQTAVYEYEGALNKFLIDDKGATIILLFGLPPSSHENDPQRAVSCSLRAVDDLRRELQLDPAVGITTGTAFCGVLGSQTRKEYSVLGDIVNLSARLMQASRAEAGAAHARRNATQRGAGKMSSRLAKSMRFGGGSSKSAAPPALEFFARVYCDEATQQAARRSIEFRELQPLEVKGKAHPIAAFEPAVGTPEGAAAAAQSAALAGRGPAQSVEFLAPMIAGAGPGGSRSPTGAARFNSVDLVAAERLASLEGTGRKENLRMYFKVPASLKPGGAKQRGGTLKRSNKPKAAATAAAAAALAATSTATAGKASAAVKRASRRLSGSMFGKGEARAGTRGGRGSKTRGEGAASRATEPEEFAFDIEELDEPSPRSNGGRGSVARRRSVSSGAASADGEAGAAPQRGLGPRRESFIFYNDSPPSPLSVHTPSAQMFTQADICRQAAIGARDLRRLASAERDGETDAGALLELACKHARAVGLLRPDVDDSDVALLIQGTEVELTVDLWPTNRARVDCLLDDAGSVTSAGSAEETRNGDGAPRSVPSKYFEAMVTEALANGEINENAAQTLAHLLSAAGLGKQAQRQAAAGRASKKDRSASLAGVTAERYTDTRNNMGATLKLVLVPRKDLPTIQSPVSVVTQTLMTRKIELMEFAKGSVTVIEGDAGSGKTHLLRRFGHRFLPFAVTVFSSTEVWEHTKTEYEAAHRLEGADGRATARRQFRKEARDLHVWFDILGQWVAAETGSGGRVEPARQKQRTALVRSALSPGSLPYASLLNEELGTEFFPPEGAAAQALDCLDGRAYKAQKLTLVADMVCEMVAHVARAYKTGVIVLVDDAMRLDPQSWRVAGKLAGMVANDELELMLVLTLRPFDGYVDRTLGLRPALVDPRTRDALDEYRALCALNAVQHVRLGPLSTNLALDMFRVAVGDNVQVVAPDLWALCESRCHNNPLLIKEFAAELRAARRPKLVRYTPLADLGHGAGSSAAAAGGSGHAGSTRAERTRGLVRGGAAGGKGAAAAAAVAADRSQRYQAALRVKVQDLDEPAWVVHAAHKAARSKQAVFLTSKRDGRQQDHAKLAAALAAGDADDLLERESRKANFSGDLFAPAEVPPPASAAGVLGARIDRLDSLEQMVLKIAAVVGNTFSLRLVQDVYPRNALDAEAAGALVKTACENLADQHGLLHKIRANAYNDEYVYRFADALLVSMLRHRMLRRYKASLRANISRARSQYRAALDLEMLQREDALIAPVKRGAAGSITAGPPTGRPSSLMLVRQNAAAHGLGRVEKEGVVQMRKRGHAASAKLFTSDWKERYLVLHPDCLLVFKKRDANAAKMTQDHAHMIIALADASVRLQEPEKPGPHSTAFVLESSEWARRGDNSFDWREFTFAAAEDAESRRWFSRVSMVLNKLRLGPLLPAWARANTGLGGSAGTLVARDLLPVRHRTDRDFAAALMPEESALFLTLQRTRHEASSKRPTLTQANSTVSVGSNGAKPGAALAWPEIYASVVLKLGRAQRLVRKQTMLNMPLGPQLLDFGESFVFMLRPELLVDWAKHAANAGAWRNAAVQVTLWRQKDNAIGFDRMLGFCELALPDLFAHKASRVGIGRELDIAQPYAEVQIADTVLDVRARLVISNADAAAVASLAAGAAGARESPQVVGEDLFNQNAELCVRAETSALVTKEASARKSRRSSRSAVGRTPTPLGDITPVASLAQRQEAQLRARNLRPQAPRAGNADDDDDEDDSSSAPTRRSSRKSATPPRAPPRRSAGSVGAGAAVPPPHTAQPGSGRLNGSLLMGRRAPVKRSSSIPDVAAPLDATLFHIDHLLQHDVLAKDRAQRDAFDQLKQLLLTRSLASLVNTANLDETSRLWLGTEFTRESSFRVAGSLAGPGAAAAAAAAVAASAVAKVTGKRESKRRSKQRAAEASAASSDEGSGKAERTSARAAPPPLPPRKGGRASILRNLEQEMERAANAYVQACQRQLTLLGPDGAVPRSAPQPLSHFLTRVARAQMDPGAIRVRVHPGPASTTAAAAAAATTTEDVLLADYLDELRLQAVGAATAAVRFRETEADDSRAGGPSDPALARASGGHVRRSVLALTLLNRTQSSASLLSAATATPPGSPLGGALMSPSAFSAAGKAATAAAARAKKRSGDGGAPLKLRKKETWASVQAAYTKFAVKAAPAGPERRRCADVSEWGFDLQLVPSPHRAHMVSHMFMSLQLHDAFAVPLDRLFNFVTRVHACMSVHSTPYHNFDHACDVTQAVFAMLGPFGAARYLDPVQQLGLLLGALCHDLEHPGLNNAFQNRAQTPLAVMYKGRSVLESHHCAVAFDLLRDEATNVAAGMEDDEAAALRKVILECILATDMTIHFDLTGELRNCIVRHLSGSDDDDDDLSAADAQRLAREQERRAQQLGVGDGAQLQRGDFSAEERLLLCKSVLHCADISNPARPWASAKRWQDLVTEEFFVQGDLEKANGWDCSPNMDRATTRQEEMSLNFIDFIVAPLFFALASLLPRAGEPCLELAANRERWMAVLEDRVAARPDLRDDDARAEALLDWDTRAGTFAQILAAAGFSRGADGALTFIGDGGGRGRGLSRKDSAMAIAFVDAATSSVAVGASAAN